MGTYYHISSSTLGEGSIILPGNWGRMIGRYGGANEVLYREHILEDARLRLFPSKPSRLASFFAVETLDDARKFRDQNSPFGLIYEVEIECDPSAMHRGNWSRICDYTPPIIDSMRAFAEAYWTLDPVECVEVFCESPASVTRQCT